MKERKEIRISNGWICQITGKKIIPVFGDILISEGLITKIEEGDFNEFLSMPDYKADADLDAGGRVITIPNTNFHDHFYSRLAKGLPIKDSMDNFENILKNLWWKIDRALDKDMIKASAQMAVLESIRNGVTYIFDHHSSPDSTDGSLEIIADEIKKAGIRGVLCFEVTDRNGEVLSDAGVSENVKFLNHSTDSNIKALMGLHASFTLNDETLSRVSEAVEELGLGIHIHLCEDKSDRVDSLKRYNKLPVDRLIKFNLLNDKSILAHGIHLTDQEYDLIADRGSSIVYNIDSNLNNSVGLPDFTRVPDTIPVLAGTDGMNANPARTLKQIFLLSRNMGMSFEESFDLCSKIYSDQLNFIKKYFPDFPTLNIKDRADLVVWDYIPPTPFNEDNFWGHFIYGILDRPVQSVIQNGNILMNDFKIMMDTSAYQNNIVAQGNRLYNKWKELNSE